MNTGGYLKIDPVINGRGLFNQLLSLVNCLIIGHMTKRWVYDPQMMPDCWKSNYLPWSSILDISQLNKLLNSLHLDVKIVVTPMNVEWSVPSYRDMGYAISTDLVPICDRLKQEAGQYVDIGCAFPLSLNSDPSMKEIELTIHRELPFLPNYIQIVDYCIQTYLNSTFYAVHFRLEDDWINHHMTTTQIHDFQHHSKHIFDNYIHAMEKLFSPTDNIYIATHLLKSTNKNNWMIDRIREKYKNVVIATPWRDKFHLPIGREIDALIDYLICIRSDKFIGCGGSTFSAAIANILRYQQKPVEII